MDMKIKINAKYAFGREHKGSARHSLIEKNRGLSLAAFFCKLCINMFADVSHQSGRLSGFLIRIEPKATRYVLVK